MKLLYRILVCCALSTVALNAAEAASGPEENVAAVPADGGSLRVLVPIFRDATTKREIMIQNGRIDLSGQELQLLPDFSGLTEEQAAAVTTLDLSNNDLRRIFAGQLSPFKNMRTIALRNNPNLVVLPLDLFAGLLRITHLDLRDCALAFLQEGLFDDTVQLERLLLEGNRLVALPSFERCRELRELDVSNNKLADMPDLKALVRLERLNLARNTLIGLPVDRLPLGAGSPLAVISCATNRLADVPFPVIDALAGKNAVLDLRDNPCWEAADARERVAEYQVEGNRFTLKHDTVSSDDSFLAKVVRERLYGDTREKFLDFVASTDTAAPVEPVRRMLNNRHSLERIRTVHSDRLVSAYETRHWWMTLGGAAGGLVIGGGVGAFFLRGAVRRGIATVGGAVLGGVAGKGLAVANDKHMVWTGTRGTFVDWGTGVIDTTTRIKNYYRGAALVTVLLAVLLQYSSAFNAYCEWLQHRSQRPHDPYLLPDALRVFEESLHARERVMLRCSTEAEFVAVLSQLLSEDAASQVRSHAPEGAFTERLLQLERILDAAIEVPLEPVVVDAPISAPVITREMLVHIRNCIVFFARTVWQLRATAESSLFDHAAVLRAFHMIEERTLLPTQIGLLNALVMDPLLEEMGRRYRDDVPAGGPVAEWLGHLTQLRACLRDTRSLITKILTIPA